MLTVQSPITDRLGGQGTLIDGSSPGEFAGRVPISIVVGSVSIDLGGRFERRNTRVHRVMIDEHKHDDSSTSR